MGCDIHTHVETRKDGHWYHHGWRTKHAVGEYSDGSTKYDWDALFDDPLFIGRNYDLFAILANVRNGYGFAGTPTSGGFTPIDMPRGLPDDVTPEVKRESDGWGVDAHSHSWLLLDELLSFDYDGQTVKQYGVVGPEQYKKFKEQGRPTAWSANVWGANVVKISNSEMDAVISGEGDDRSYYTRVEWEETYRDAVGPRWFETLDTLKELGAPEDVRLVFWFDN